MSVRTALYDQHLRLQAKMVDFFGWMMPLHYGSSIQEHLQVRQNAGIFDVSHMTTLDLLGAGGRQFLRKLLTQDIDRIPHSGKGLYSCMCHEHGGIIDDLIVYQLSPERFRLIFNASTKNKVLAWIESMIEGFSVGLQLRSDLSMIAIQGPHARARLMDLLSNQEVDSLTTLGRFECVEINERFYARTGYTGEDGLEVLLPHTQAQPLWSQLIQAGFQPCGLAARDSLRLEAGLMLYGQDMDETTSPLECGLEWTVTWEPADRDFIGMRTLLDLKNHQTQKTVGLVLEHKGILRSHQPILCSNGSRGITTSGGFAPSLNCSIALARVPIDTQDHAQVEIRGQWLPVRVISTRFLKELKPKPSL
jgi:aminomethyltransferase